MNRTLQSLFIYFRGLLLFFLFSFSCITANAQKPNFKQILLNRENSNLGVTCLIQGHDGFLWFGTSDGVYNFDGTEYVFYSIKNKDFNNSVSVIYQDQYDTTWIGYKSGQIAFIKDHEIKLFYPEEGVPKKAITSISKDKNENLWITTAGEGVYYYLNNRLYNINTDDGLNDNYTYTTAADNKGNMWIGTDEGLALCTTDHSKKVIKTFHKHDGLPDNIVKVIVPDSTGNLWLGLQEQGICKFLVNENKFLIPGDTGAWHYGQVNSIVLNGSELWIGTSDHGIIFFDEKEKRELHLFLDFNTPQVSNISGAILDKEGNLWIVANSNIFQSTGNRIMILDKAGDVNLKMIHTLLCDSKGNLWFTPDQGLVAYPVSGGKSIKKYTITPPEKLIDIVSLYEDECNYIWIGTMGAGLYRLNNSNGKIQRITGSRLLNNASIMSVTGKGKTLWIGTLGGALKITLPENCNSDSISTVIENLANEKLLGNFYIYDVMVDSKNRVWFGTDGKGITSLENNVYHNYSVQAGLKSDVIYSITEDESRNVWFGTLNDGIYKYNGSTFKNYGLQDGLRSLSISSILSDGKGNIIIVHKNGLDVLNTKTDKVLYYGQEAGIDDINSDLNSIGMDQQGDIWIGTDNSIIRYHNTGKAYALVPYTVITRVALFANEIKNKLTRDLSYNQNYLSFDFVGLWYSNPERVKYQYLLEGYNNVWIATTDHRIIFPNLPYGKYTFKIRSSLNSNFRQSSEATYEFSIRPPFWREPWFILFAVVVVAGLVYYFTRLRIMQVKRMESLKKEKVEFQFETLRNQVNPHFLFNSFNTLITTIEEDQETAIEYAETLSAFFRNIVTYKDYDLISLKEELQVANNYFFLQQKRYGKNLDLVVQVTEDAMTREVPPLVLQILIENAVKHNSISSETPLKIFIESKENKLVIKNNINPKLTSEPSTKTGLQNIINRYKFLTNETLEVKQDEKQFIVTIPLI